MDALLPESDEEKGTPEGDAAKAEKGEAEKAEKPAEKKEAEKTPPKVTIDPDGIEQRIVALPIPARSYSGLYPGKTGVLFLLEDTFNIRLGGGPQGRTLYKFELKTRKTDRVIDGVRYIQNALKYPKDRERQTLPLKLIWNGQEPAARTTRTDHAEIEEKN